MRNTKLKKIVNLFKTVNDIEKIYQGYLTYIPEIPIDKWQELSSGLADGNYGYCENDGKYYYYHIIDPLYDDTVIVIAFNVKKELEQFKKACKDFLRIYILFSDRKYPLPKTKICTHCGRKFKFKVKKNLSSEDFSKLIKNWEHSYCGCDY